MMIGNVALTFPSGTVFLLQGPRGGGKATLLSVLDGLGPLSDGVDRWARGTAPSGGSRPRSFGCVFAPCRLLPMLTTVENVRLPLDLRGDEFDAAEARARYLLTLVGLPHRLTAVPNELDPGERQRVAIARALALDPRGILANQPTASLDSACCHAVAVVLQRTAAELGKAVVILSDDDRLTAFADRCFQIDRGSSQSPFALLPV